MAYNYRDRRYKVVDGKLKKQFDSPAPDGWFVTKVEAWEVWNAAEAAAHDSAKVAAKTVSIGYAKRRYAVIDGKLQKKWDEDPTWFTTKDEAWAAHAAESAEQHPPQAAKDPPETAPETPPVNGGDPDPTATPEAETPKPKVTEEPPEAEPTGETPESEIAGAEKVLRVPAVCDLLGWSRTTLFRKTKQGKFMAPLDLGNGHIGWLETQIVAWLRDQPGASQAPEAAI